MPEPAPIAPAAPAAEGQRLAPAERSRLVALLFGMNLINYVDRVNAWGLSTGEWTVPFLTAAAALLLASLVLGLGFRARPLEGAEPDEGGR